MKKVYLLVDDQADRVFVFKQQVEIRDVLEFVPIGDPARLVGTPDHVLDDFTGVIADFHLHTSTRPGYRPLRCTDPDDPARSIDVETGIGVMLYMRQRVGEGIPLFGFTELTHRHAPFFLTASQEWLGACPLNANEDPEILRQVLLSEGLESDLQPSYQQMSDSCEPFRRLMDSCLTRRPKEVREAYDWLRCFRRTSGPRAHTQLREEMRRVLGVAHKADPDKTVLPLVGEWQEALAEFLEAWGEDTSHWPKVPEKPTTKTWAEFNPVLEYVREEHYSQFFTAPDVRAALSYYRHQNRKDDGTCSN